MDNTWQTQTRRVAFGVRKRVLELTLKNNGCYLSQTLSSADVLATLYTKALNLGPSEAPYMPTLHPGVPGENGIEAGYGATYNGPRGPENDRLLISPAHYAVAIYATLAETGRLSPEAFYSFNTDGSTVEMIGAEHSPGFELTTGSFGQAVSQAGGIAFAKRLRGESGRCVVFMSDGELEEGQTWEGLQCLAHYKMDNVIVIVDVNGMQCDGATADMMNVEPINTRIEAFGCKAVVVDAHDVEAIDAAINETEHAGQPLVILCYSNSSEGIPLLDHRKPKLHYVRFGSAEETAQYQDFLDNWTFEEA
ncbi:transketolase [Pacificoceanicola onchidii]|uniref:transketolase n=1 Tax=Pacificoceanicola onchidii TaxID=2562685 RepID=UPI0010A65BA1|nr:1-deoxy-D-xylulose-5-phosphate synthase N-terminal domain-containing protein [Pacificoceanicola onchidii]